MLNPIIWAPNPQDATLSDPVLDRLEESTSPFGRGTGENNIFSESAYRDQPSNAHKRSHPHGSNDTSLAPYNPHKGPWHHSILSWVFLAGFRTFLLAAGGKVMAGPISYLISATEIKPRSAPVDYTLTMHAAYWRRHTAPLGLPTALDVGKEEELEDFGCFFDRAGVGRTSISGPYHPDNPVENMANCGWCRGFAGVWAMERARCRDPA